MVNSTDMAPALNRTRSGMALYRGVIGYDGDTQEGDRPEKW